jgi:hypothetical protein
MFLTLVLLVSLDFVQSDGFIAPLCWTIRQSHGAGVVVPALAPFPGVLSSLTEICNNVTTPHSFLLLVNHTHLRFCCFQKSGIHLLSRLNCRPSCMRTIRHAWKIGINAESCQASLRRVQNKEDQVHRNSTLCWLYRCWDTMHLQKSSSN